MLKLRSARKLLNIAVADVLPLLLGPTNTVYRASRSIEISSSLRKFRTAILLIMTLPGAAVNVSRLYASLKVISKPVGLVSTFHWVVSVKPLDCARPVAAEVQLDLSGTIRAMSGSSYFLPLNLIQVQGYTGVEAAPPCCPSYSPCSCCRAGQTRW